MNCLKCKKKVRGAYKNTFVICKKCHALGWRIERVDYSGGIFDPKIGTFRMEKLKALDTKGE